MYKADGAKSQNLPPELLQQLAKCVLLECVQIYFFSSFWGQFGPNCTTFLLAGELYPTEVRTTAHGISAGVAKLGALWAAVWFNYLDKRLQFWLTASFNIGG